MQVADKQSVVAYLNDELHRHIEALLEKQTRAKERYDAEKTKIRRAFRQMQSERAKDASSAKTKTGLDEEKEAALAKLKEEFAKQCGDPKETEMVQSIKETALEAGSAVDFNSVSVLSEGNIMTHLGPAVPIADVLKQIISKLR